MTKINLLLASTPTHATLISGAEVCVLLALSIQAIYTGYNTLCLSSYGTRAFLNGEPQATAYICSNYDYTPYFPASMRETVSNLSR